MKRFISSHLIFPFKTFLVGYCIAVILYHLNGEYFEWGNMFAYFMAAWFAYMICAAISGALAFNKNKIAPYALEDTICKESLKLTSGYYLLDGKPGVYKSRDETHKLDGKHFFETHYTLISDYRELYERLRTAEKILNATGTYYSKLVLDDHKLYIRELRKMIDGEIPGVS